MLDVASPPETLDFNVDYNFLQLSPGLAQLFFICDGCATRLLPRFEIPAGATRLYLGIVDAFGFRGPPGYYDDNIGAFDVTVQFP